MIRKICNIYPESFIAIIASAPSALKYRDRGYQATIGVNGGGQLLERSRGDKYFFSADILASHQPWYLCKKNNNITHILRSLAAVFSPIIYPSQTQREQAICYVENHLNIDCNKLKTSDEMVKWFRNLPSSHPLHEELLTRFPPETNHILFTTDPHIQVNQYMRKLRSGGTSAGGALQVAYITGAKEIHLYGVEFSNQGEPYKSKNYFYKGKFHEGGHTNETQKMVMEELIQIIQQQGVKIFHHGKTNLKHLIVLD